MDFTISEEILKIAFPALCGIGGVVVGAVLKSWFDWKLESKKAEQQRRLVLYESQREAAQDIYKVTNECFQLIILLKKDISKDDDTINKLSSVTENLVNTIQKYSLYLPKKVKHKYTSFYLKTANVVMSLSLNKHIKNTTELDKIDINVMRDTLLELEEELRFLIGWRKKDL